MSAPIRASAAMLLLLWQHADGFAPTFPKRQAWGLPSSIVARSTSGMSATTAAPAAPVGTPPSPVPAPTVAALEGWFTASHHELRGGVTVSAAATLPGVLAQTWASIARATDDDKLYLFPACELLGQPGMMETLMDHLETCKNQCDRFGSSIAVYAVSPFVGPDHPSYAPAPGLLIKRFGTGGLTATDEEDDDWDDFDVDPALLLAALEADAKDAEAEEAGGADGEGLTARELAQLAEVPGDDETLVQLSKDWVDAMIAGMGVCPFTTSAERAGLPLGKVHYPVERTSETEAIYASYWAEVELLETTTDRALSTTLMITPNFGMHNPEAFMVFSDSLTGPLEGLKLEDTIQLVFFHPQWVFRDGGERQEAAANFARRSPFPMINILRTPQVRAGRPLRTSLPPPPMANTSLGLAGPHRAACDSDRAGVCAKRENSDRRRRQAAPEDARDTRLGRPPGASRGQEDERPFRCRARLGGSVCQDWCRDCTLHPDG